MLVNPRVVDDKSVPIHKEVVVTLFVNEIDSNRSKSRVWIVVQLLKNSSSSSIRRRVMGWFNEQKPKVLAPINGLVKSSVEISRYHDSAEIFTFNGLFMP